MREPLLRFTFSLSVACVSEKILLLVVPVQLMGRTVPTWRNRVEDELALLKAYRRGLNSGDRNSLDGLVNGVRNRRAAGGMLPSLDVWKPMLISMLLECCRKISELEKIIQKLQSEK